MEERPHNSPRNSAHDPVICRVCGTENRPTRLFCAQCGTYLKGEEEDTWVDLPGLPPTAAPPEGTPPPSAGHRGETPQMPAPGAERPPTPPTAPAPLVWDEPYQPRSYPPDRTPPGAAYGAAASGDRGAGFTPSRPPKRRRHWLLAAFLVILLLAAAGVTGAVAYRSLIAPDDVIDDGGTADGAGSTATTVAGDPGTGTTTEVTPTTSDTSATSTTPDDDKGDPLLVVSTSASSTLPAEGANDYRGRNLIDGRLSTCWSEGVEGTGAEEWVRLDIGASTRLATIEIANGYQKDERRFAGNPRVDTLRIEYSDGSSQLVRLHDDMGFQSITAPPTPTEWVKLVIVSTYPGDTWEDASISEVRLYRAH